MCVLSAAVAVAAAARVQLCVRPPNLCVSLLPLYCGRNRHKRRKKGERDEREERAEERSNS